MRAHDTILSSVTNAELEASIAEAVKNPLLDLGRVSNGLTSMVADALARLEPEQSKRVTDSLIRSLGGTPKARPSKDKSLREMRDIASGQAKGINEANEAYWAKHRV